MGATAIFWSAKSKVRLKISILISCFLFSFISNDHVVLLVLLDISVIPMFLMLG